MTDAATEQVERELTLLIQRALRGPLLDDGTGRVLERPAYAVLARLHDDGPMRLTALATLLGLDPSTVSRHVQGLAESGLLHRTPDAQDRRATQVGLTPEGRERLLATRQRRRATLHGLLAAWPEPDRAAFARLLERFNADAAEALASARVTQAPDPGPPAPPRPPVPVERRP